MRLTASSQETLAPDVPVFVVAWIPSEPGVAAWDRLLVRDDVRDAGVIEFAIEASSSRLMQSLVIPARLMPAVHAHLISEFRADPNDIALYALTQRP
jgi:hypothetical protein